MTKTNKEKLEDVTINYPQVVTLEKAQRMFSTGAFRKEILYLRDKVNNVYAFPFTDSIETMVTKID